MLKKVTIVLWFTAIIGLLFYSYTQIDLNLTITRNISLNNVLKSFQYIGYFQRPMSTVIYLVLLLLLFTLYLIFICLKLSRREVWLLIIPTAVILLFSYPAFSYDIFNYMFDAKTIAFYHQNPWQYRPLDFKNDPWLSFMHWTHRPSVYPAGWVFLSVPFYYLGFGVFILQLLSFKLLITLFYLLSIYLISKNSKSTSILVFYALNPLMLIENLVSGHNDIVMIALALLSVYLYLYHKKIIALIIMIASINIKYVTGILLLIFPLNIKPLYVYRLSFILMIMGLLYMLTRVELQPWYFVWFFPFLVLSGWRALKIIAVGFSAGLLLRYVPYLFWGNWDSPVPMYNLWLTILPVLLSMVVAVLYERKSI